MATNKRELVSILSSHNRGKQGRIVGKHIVPHTASERDDYLGKMAARSDVNRPLDLQAEAIRAHITRLEGQIEKAALKRNRDKVSRLSGLLAQARTRLAIVLDALASADGFATPIENKSPLVPAKIVKGQWGPSFTPKSQDKTSYHPHTPQKRPASGRKGKASVRHVPITPDLSAAILERSRQGEAKTARQVAAGIIRDPGHKGPALKRGTKRHDKR